MNKVAKQGGYKPIQKMHVMLDMSEVINAEGDLLANLYEEIKLLPNLEGVDTVARQIEICRSKAGIPSYEPVKLYRFEVKRYR